MNEQEEAALCSPELSDWNPNVIVQGLFAYHEFGIDFDIFFHVSTTIA